MIKLNKPNPVNNAINISFIITANIAYTPYINTSTTPIIAIIDVTLLVFFASLIFDATIINPNNNTVNPNGNGTTAPEIGMQTVKSSLSS